MNNEIPIVDISSLVSERLSNEESKMNVCESIRRACEQVGFFQIIGHGVNQELFDAMVKEAKRFFSQSEQEKMKYAVKKWNVENRNSYRGYFPSSVNGKEGLDISSPYLHPLHELVKQGDPLHELNLWPVDGVITQYWDEMCKTKIFYNSIDFD